MTNIRYEQLVYLILNINRWSYVANILSTRYVLNIKAHLRSKENWFLCTLIEDRTLSSKDQLVFDYFNQRFRVCVVVEKHCSPITETAFPQDSWKGGVLEYFLWILSRCTSVQTLTNALAIELSWRPPQLSAHLIRGESNSEAWLHHVRIKHVLMCLSAHSADFTK